MRNIFTFRSSYNYLVNHKKPIVQLPSTKPPKYVYEIQYHPNWKPTLDKGFQDHHHSNPFQSKAFSEFQLFQYKYTGQWWHQGSNIIKIIVFITPLIGCIYSLYIDNKNAQQGLPSIKNMRNTVDSPFNLSRPFYEI